MDTARRRFVSCAAVAMLATPLAAAAQQTRKVWRIGLFHVGTDHVPPSLDGLREGLRTLGYDSGTWALPLLSHVMVGRNTRLDWRNVGDEAEAQETAKEFVSSRVDLIVAFENQAIRAAKSATTQIPIVMVHATDPLEDGFVTSVSRPGGNLTGFAGGFFFDKPGKLLELFKELVPRLNRLLVLIDPEDPVSKRLVAEVRVAAPRLKITLVEREVHRQDEVERVFQAMRRGSLDGVVAISPTIITKYSTLLIRLASERQLPMPTHRKEWVEQGGLFSYAPDGDPIGRAAAGYVDRILRGTKAGELPVQFPTEWKLVINLKTAKALGLTIPPSLLLRADQVIE